MAFRPHKKIYMIKTPIPMKHKICVCIIDNDFSALKILYSSLINAGYRFQDIIFIELECSTNSIGFDIMFNVTKISCKSSSDIQIYKYDAPLLDDHGDPPFYVFVTENVEFTRNTKSMIETMLRDKASRDNFFAHGNKFSCLRISEDLSHVITREMYQVVHTHDMEVVRQDASLVGFTHKFMVYMIREFNILVYI